MSNQNNNQSLNLQESIDFSIQERKTFQDITFIRNISNKNCNMHLFIRVTAIKKTFSDVDFKYSIFDTTYFRNCNFQDCNFTGCRFIGSNFRGTSFAGCNFEYSYFENTIFDDDFIDNNSSKRENLKQKFARSLRANYQQLCDIGGINKAILVELDATAIHLKKAWSSSEEYYKKKYGGFYERVKMFGQWLWFTTMQYLWGHGESFKALFICFGLIFLLLPLFYTIENENYLDTFFKILQNFFEISSFTDYNMLIKNIIKPIFFTMFIAIFFKRLTKR